MNTTTMEGTMKQLRAKAKRQWGKLTEDDLARVKGTAEELVGVVQETYGYARGRAEDEVNAFLSGLSEASSEVESRASEVVGQTKTWVADHFWQTVLGALFAGFVAGVLATRDGHQNGREQSAE